jgi:hypothetical protein
MRKLHLQAFRVTDTTDTNKALSSAVKRIYDDINKIAHDLNESYVDPKKDHQGYEGQVRVIEKNGKQIIQFKKKKGWTNVTVPTEGGE